MRSSMCCVRHPVARPARALRALYDGLQSLQPLVSARRVEADVRQVGGEIARQPISDRQHDREGPSRGQRRKRGEKNQAIGKSRGGRSTKIHAVVDSKGRPLNFTVTGGQVHDSQVVEAVLDTPRPPPPSPPTRLTTVATCVSRSRMRGPCRSFPAAAMPPRKPTVPSASTGAGTRSKTSSAASRTGGASLPDTPGSPETSLPPQRSSAHSTGSNCESRP